jgi:HK97 gp10 family phage protein
MPLRIAPDAPSFGFALAGFDGLQEVFTELPKAIQNRIGRAATLKAARIVAAEAKRLVPKRTGELAKAIKPQQAKKLRPSLTGATANVTGKEGPLAHLIEFGTAPHAIFAGKSKSVLKFVWNGEVRFFARVRHPGYVKSTPFMRNALQNTAGQAVDAIVTSTLDGIVREMTKPEVVSKAARDRARASSFVR